MRASRKLLTVLLFVSAMTVAPAAKADVRPTSDGPKAGLGSPGGPLPGQIIVDPDNPSWFVYNRDEDADGRLDPFFMCGPGDPEDFLYRGARNPDGTRSGDQEQLMEKLQGTGANSLYLMAVRSHGGDGDATHNPFVDSDPTKGLDDDILAQWESWFAELDDNGIVIFFFLYDDSARIWSGDEVSHEERAFIKGLVDRFAHHRHLVWVVAEEYGERYSVERVKGIAAEIRDADEHAHPIAVHKRSGLDFAEFATDPNIDQFAIQYNASAAAALHKGIVSAWQAAAGRYNLNLAESAEHGTGTGARRKSWAAAMAGAYVMVLRMDIASTDPRDLEDCGRLAGFMERAGINTMAPHDELAFGGTDYVLADPGERYIAYAADLTVPIGLRSLKAGRYRFTWFDPSSGATVVQDDVRLPAGDQTWKRPAGIGREVAVLVQHTDGPDAQAPTASKKADRK